MRFIPLGLVLVVLVWCTSVAGNQALPQGEPPDSRPPWQRLLGPQEQQQAVRLQKQINSAWEEQKWDLVVQAAEELVGLRDKAQGAEHWQVVNARAELQTWRRLAGGKPEEQQGYVRAAQQTSQAQALEQKGQPRPAQPLRQEVLDFYRKTLGEEHTYTATAYSYLALNQQAQGKYAEAEQGYRKALEIDGKALEGDHPDTARAYHGLAFNQYRQGKYGEAKQGCRKALEILCKALGDEHPDTASEEGVH